MNKTHAPAVQSILLITAFLFIFANTGIAAEEYQLKDVIKKVMPATVLVITYDAKGELLQQGSGFFISEKGEIITNYHVMEGGETAKIKTPNGGVYKITEILSADEISDLIKMQADIGRNKVKFLTINTTIPETGDKVVIIGNPKGLESTVSEGIVSAVRRVSGFGSIIQTTAPISPGSSGSPVVNMKGEVVGVATAQMEEGQNLNFIVPAEKIIQLKKNQKAIASEGKGGKENKDDGFNHFRAWLNYYAGYYKGALDAFQKILITTPNDANIFFYAGVCYNNLGQYQQAIDAYKQAIRLKTDFFAKAHYNLGVAYAALGINQEAIRSYKHAIELNPNYEKEKYSLGYIYVDLGGNREAIEVYMQNINSSPENAVWHNNLGGVYADLGRNQEAIKFFKQAIKLKPDFVDAHFNLGIIYLSLDDSGNALKQYKTLKNLNAERANKLFNEIIRQAK